MSSSTHDQLQRQLDAERRLVSFDSYDLSVRQMLDMVEEGAVVVPPEYQRQFIWKEARQSTLIESVLLGIPVPSLFMATNPDATWEVVDGVQRLGSLAHFVGEPKLLQLIDKPMPLQIEGLEKLTAMNGVKFAQLPKSVQLHFFTRPLRVTVLNDKSDLGVRFDLFERLNTGGVALTEQEIRNCVYRGKFNDSLRALAKDPRFLAVARLGENPEGGAYDELVLRFFAYLNKYQQFDHSVKGFLNDYMRDNRNEAVPNIDVNSFDQTFTFLEGALPNGIVRSRAKTPVNLFEAITVGVALAFESNLNPRPAKVRNLLQNEDLKRLTGAGSNSRKLVQGRIEFVRDSVV